VGKGSRLLFRSLWLLCKREKNGVGERQKTSKTDEKEKRKEGELEEKGARKEKKAERKTEQDYSNVTPPGFWFKTLLRRGMAGTRTIGAAPKISDS